VAGVNASGFDVRGVDKMIRFVRDEFDGMYVGDIALFDGYFVISVPHYYYLYRLCSF
jgi:hypothetical protein